MDELENRVVEIVNEFVPCTCPPGDWPSGYSHHNDCKCSAAITRILAACTPAPGHVRDGTVDRKVLGTLALTADGFVVGPGGLPWCSYEEWGEIVQADDIIIKSCQGPLDSNAEAFFAGEIQDFHEWVPIASCYSTREAAEAARKEGGA